VQSYQSSQSEARRPAADGLLGTGCRSFCCSECDLAVKHIVIRLEPEEYDRFDSLWRRAGFRSLQEAGLHAFRAACQAEPAPDSVPAKYRPYLRTLAAVFASGDENLIGLLLAPLEYARKQLK
jgi:hypothetical protein